MSEPIAAQVQRLNIKPGEMVLLQVDHELTREYIDLLREQISRSLPDNKAIVLGPGMTLRALTDEERAALGSEGRVA